MELRLSKNTINLRILLKGLITHSTLELAIYFSIVCKSLRRLCILKYTDNIDPASISCAAQKCGGLELEIWYLLKCIFYWYWRQVRHFAYRWSLSYELKNGGRKHQQNILLKWHALKYIDPFFCIIFLYYYYYSHFLFKFSW